ncbi:MarR family winged helix-turn-helix transcriptional regulator [Candidatus Soleaferrea massiliensis]|uniref:MarR family winged helix-turn-helix transcriptional regulator n=1 Tax=Candidatus Soleaferrea massiliensis TaxID=1470354 RepID=UPI00058B6648|nr:MarR family transcriptional regulator [Candidatus Soleaferrea massiliensis]
MEESFHYLLMINHAMLQKRLFSCLKDTGLTSGQPKVLDYLKEHDGMTQKDIAQACRIEPTSVTAVLLGMEEKGIIERRMLNGNRRSLHVFLTEKGRLLLDEVNQAFDTVEAQCFQGIGPQELEQFLTTFRKMRDNLKLPVQERRDG